MSGFFSQFNQRATVKEGINLEDLEFHPLKDYIGGEIIVDGYFFTNGRYGKQVVVVGNDAKINMPKYATAMFERIDDNDEAVNKMLEGGMKLINIEEKTTKNGTTVIFEAADNQ